MIDKIYKILEKEVRKYPLPLSDSVYENTKSPFLVLIATILSAQTRDSLTIKVCDNLFKTIKTKKDLKNISLEELEKLIKSINFYKNKAKYLKQLVDYEITDNIDDLIKIPGVGRKTANVFLAVAYQKPAIGVDVHVHRISNRLGLIETKTTLETEERLKEVLPKKYWNKFNLFLVILGQNICLSRKPKCDICKIKDLCLKKI